MATEKSRGKAEGDADYSDKRNKEARIESGKSAGDAAEASKVADVKAPVLVEYAQERREAEDGLAQTIAREEGEHQAILRELGAADRAASEELGRDADEDAAHARETRGIDAGHLQASVERQAEIFDESAEVQEKIKDTRDKIAAETEETRRKNEAQVEAALRKLASSR